MAALETTLRKDLRHNVRVNLLDGGAFGGAIGFGSFGTILPLFVSQFTSSAPLIGLVPAIHAVGWQLPQLFTANTVARMRRYKPAVMLYTIHERVPFLGLAIVALVSPRLNVNLVLVLTFAMLIWQGLGGGLTANPWQSMIAKIFPNESRGTFLGAQGAVANVGFSLTAVAAGYLLQILHTPADYAVCFFLACVFMALSYASLSLTREPEDTQKTIPERQAWPWRGARRVLRADANFSWFLAVRILSQFGTMSFVFYIVYALHHFQMDPITAGFLTATLAITQTVANASMGFLGDRFGHRSMLITGALAAMLSSLVAWAAPTLAWMYLVFILAGIANVSLWTISMAITVEFGTERERPVYIGLANTLVAPATILAPILGGLIAEAWGYSATFALSAAISLAVAGILFSIVKDPVTHAQKETYEPVS
jgi:MFS family permease